MKSTTIKIYPRDHLILIYGDGIFFVHLLLLAVLGIQGFQITNGMSLKNCFLS
jgi:hypothetical protein